MTVLWLSCAVLVMTGCGAGPSHPTQASTPTEQPGEVAVATVLGTAISASQLESDSVETLRGAVLEPLFEKYRKDHGIAATQTEIDECVRALFRRADRSQTVSDPSEEPDAEFETEFARGFVLDWKTSRQLYRDYGGQVIFQQFNPLEPVGAYLAFLREQEQKGAFRIHDEARAAEFWRYFTADHAAWTVDPGKVDYSAPWWTRK